jgi:hypothetical protein
MEFLFIVSFYHTSLSLADSMRVIHSVEASVGSAQRLSSNAGRKCRKNGAYFAGFIAKEVTVLTVRLPALIKFFL